MIQKNMFVGVGIILLSSLFLLSSVTAAGSSSETEFNIPGCTFQDIATGEFVGLSIGSCSVGGEYSGKFYCDSDQVGYVTLEEGVGCSRGENTFDFGNPLGACCPADAPFCSETGVDTGVFKCQQRINNCDASMGKSDCEAGYGYYYDDAVGDEKCICVRSDESCSVYTKEADCKADSMNIGSVGVGRSEYCGGHFSCGDKTYNAPIDSCGCSWNDGSCDHSITAVETFPDNPSDGIEFGCSSSYSIDSECIDGSRGVSWFSNSFGDTVPLECLAILGCDDGSDVLSCGEDSVKLPGFSLFSLFMALFVIGIYYFVIGNVKRKERCSYD